MRTMSHEHVVLFSSISPQSWEMIKCHAQQYDVEELDTPEHIFDLRENAEDSTRDHILVWGRDGWRDGYYHATVWVEQTDKDGTLRVQITRGPDPNSMSLESMRKMLTAIFEHCVQGDPP